MEDRVIAKRYARALVGSAKTTKNAWTIFGELSEIWEVLSLEERLRRFMELPNIDDEIKTGIMDSIALKERSPLLKRMVEKLIERGRLSVLPLILEYMEGEICGLEGTLLVVARTARELEEDLKDRMTVILKKKFGQKIRLKNIVDEDLIGGIRLDFDDRVVDGTIRGGLNELQEILVG